MPYRPILPLPAALKAIRRVDRAEPRGEKCGRRWLQRSNVKRWSGPTVGDVVGIIKTPSIEWPERELVKDILAGDILKAMVHHVDQVGMRYC